MHSYLFIARFIFVARVVRERPEQKNREVEDSLLNVYKNVYKNVLLPIAKDYINVFKAASDHRTQHSPCCCVRNISLVQNILKCLVLTIFIFFFILVPGDFSKNKSELYAWKLANGRKTDK